MPVCQPCTKESHQADLFTVRLFIFQQLKVRSAKLPLIYIFFQPRYSPLVFSSFLYLSTTTQWNPSIHCPSCCFHHSSNKKKTPSIPNYKTLWHFQLHYFSIYLNIMYIQMHWKNYVSKKSKHFIIYFYMCQNYVSVEWREQVKYPLNLKIKYTLAITKGNSK